MDFQVRVLSSIAVLVGLICLAVLLRKLKVLDESHGALFAKLVAQVTLPATIFVYLVEQPHTLVRDPACRDHVPGRGGLPGPCLVGGALDGPGPPAPGRFHPNRRFRLVGPVGLCPGVGGLPRTGAGHRGRGDHLGAGGGTGPVHHRGDGGHLLRRPAGRDQGEGLGGPGLFPLTPSFSPWPGG